MSVAERLIGRDDAIAIAVAALDRARSGAGQLLLFSGEAGIGKSAMLSHVCDRARQECLVLRGFCWNDGGVPPYWPWTQVLRASGLTADDLGAADRLLDAAGWVDPDGAVAAADAQFLLSDAIAQALARLAIDQPVVVVFDDLQWADEPSLALLSFATRALVDHPVVLVGAYRDSEAPAALRQVAATAEVVPLRGLHPGEVDAMIDAMPGVAPPPAVRELVWHRSGGNPFFVQELTRLLHAQGGSDLPRHLPASIIETVRRRLARLSTECVRLLDWAAVAGRDIDATLLADSGAADDETTVRDLLAQAAGAGIVNLADPPRFSHDLYRDAILDAMPAVTSVTINLAIARTLQAQPRPDSAGRIAGHLLAAGPAAQRDAIDYCIRAARDATARLGHEDACAHYLAALDVLDAHDPRTVGVLLALAAAHERTGSSELALQRYREAADLSRTTGDAAALADAALGMQALGHRSGAHNTEVRQLLDAAARRLAAVDGPAALQSRVHAALTRVLRHGPSIRPDDTLVRTAERAVDLADTAGDPDALAEAKLAVHDALWQPGSAADRLPVIDEMLAAAERAASADLVAQAHLLRATALLELGDPAGRDELLTYTSLAEGLGHARGRWGALTRRATFAQLDGRAHEAAQIGEEALALGQTIGEPDALGVYCTARWSLVALGVPEPDMTLDEADPLWPLLPLIRAWPHAARGDHATATGALGDFSVVNIPLTTDLEALAVAAVVFAAVGSTDQRRWAYEQLEPHAGTHVIVGGCAAYHAAVDHHLGILAHSLGHHTAAQQHLQDAHTMHNRLGAAGWARLSAQALTDLASTAPDNQFRFTDGHWLLAYAGKHIRLPDAKGLHDLWTIIGAHGTDVHVLSILGTEVAERVGTSGADSILDDRAKAEYKAHLDDLAEQIDAAEALGRTARAEQLQAERNTLIHELAAATGLGGRPRRLGDTTERARKTVSARVRDTLTKIDLAHPQLATHLRNTVRMGTNCTYAPTEPTKWQLH